MKPDALAREVEFVISQGKTKIGVLTFSGLCSEQANPLSTGSANYQQLVVPTGEKINALTMRVSGWSYTLTPDLDERTGGLFAYSLRTMKGGGFMLGLDYPLYAMKVHRAKGSIGVITAISYEPLSTYAELRPKQRKGIKSYAFFDWVATVTAWSTAPPANSILPD